MPPKHGYAYDVKLQTVLNRNELAGRLVGHGVEMLDQEPWNDGLHLSYLVQCCKILQALPLRLTSP